MTPMTDMTLLPRFGNLQKKRKKYKCLIFSIYTNLGIPVTRVITVITDMTAFPTIGREAQKPESEVVRHLKDPVSAPVEYEAGPLDKALGAITDTGPRPWVFVLGIYLGHGGRPKSFSKRLYRYQKRWPDRIVIRRGYDLSAGAFIEADSRKTDPGNLVKN